MPIWVKGFGWALVALIMAATLLVAKEVGVGQWFASWVRYANTTVVVVVTTPSTTAPVQQNQQNIVLAGGQTVSQYDIARLIAERDAFAIDARSWQDAYIALAREARDNCQRNPQLRTCSEPGHLGAQSGRPYLP